MQDYRLIYIQLEVTLRTRKGNGVVVAKNLYRHHRECLALSRIDLSRHDGRAGLVFGNLELAYSSARTTCIPTNIVPDFHQRPSECAKRPAHVHHAFVCGEDCKFVGS